MTEDRISALERLAKLKAEGAITDADFETQKTRLMGATEALKAPPLLRRLWLVVTLTVLVIGFPLALAVLASGEVYRRVDGGYRPISKGARLTYTGFLALWLVAVLAKAIFHPGDWGTGPGAKTSQAPQGSLTTATSGNGGKCEQPALAKGTPYPAARAMLLAAGYMPSRERPEAGSYCTDSDHATTCKKLPEIRDCSADGYCKMAFQGRDGAAADVTTFGDGPDGQDTTVQSVSYTCGVQAGTAAKQSTIVQAASPATPSATPAEGSLNTYTNARYNYSIVYRTDLLNIEPEAPDGDGVTLHSKDRSAVVRVFAEYNATGQIPEAIEKDAAKNCVNPSAIMAQADPTLVNVICEVSGAAIHFTRVVIKDDLLVTMDAEYPKADQLIWNPVMGRMAVSMKVRP